MKRLNGFQTQLPTFFMVVTAVLLLPQMASGQAGLRASLDRLDRNENGYIDPDEVTDLSRPYLERIMRFRKRGRNVPFDKPIPISQIQNNARLYHALQNGIGDDWVRPEGENSVKQFGTGRNDPIIPEFGIANIKFPYIQEDVDEAKRTLDREDENRDGFIDRSEASRARWTHRNPFDDDLNNDDRLSRLELAQRYARRRLLANDASELIRKSVRTGGEVQSSVKPKGEDERDDRWWRRGGNTYWLSASLLGRFDENKNGVLEISEVEKMGIPPGRLDVDRDGKVTRDELHSHVSRLQEEAGAVTEGLPGWFYEKDANRDDQVAMSEFSDDWDDQVAKEFNAYDQNKDGILTAAEVLNSAGAVGGTFRNEKAMVLPPRKTIISEIEVEDDLMVREVRMELSLTHTHVGSLDAYLTGPQGQRVELFTEVGSHGDHFERTEFRDSAETPIVKGRPPFRGSFRPEEKDKGKPGLGAFKGTNAKGVWQLVIRGTRNDRFGMLHNWAIKVTPDEDLKPTGTSSPATSSKPDQAETKESGSGLLNLIKGLNK